MSTKQYKGYEIDTAEESTGFRAHVSQDDNTLLTLPADGVYPADTEADALKLAENRIDSLERKGYDRGGLTSM